MSSSSKKWEIGRKRIKLSLAGKSGDGKIYGLTDTTHVEGDHDDYDDNDDGWCKDVSFHSLFKKLCYYYHMTCYMLLCIVATISRR